MEHLFVIAIVLLCQLFGVDGNLRCYSCAPCDEFEYFAGDISRFQTDCLLDRHCLKISGTTRDIYGYEHTISVRGCPFSFLFPKLQEGCTSSTFSVAGFGEIVGDFCLCSDHLCNSSPAVDTKKTIMILSIYILLYFVIII
nr:uncharacterized protein LOC121132357 [Lepeophtheirus salmonis]